MKEKRPFVFLHLILVKWLIGSNLECLCFVVPYTPIVVPYYQPTYLVPQEFGFIPVNMFVKYHKENMYVQSLEQQQNMVQPNIQHDKSSKTAKKGKAESCQRSFNKDIGECMPAPKCLSVFRDYRVHGVTIDVCGYQDNIAIVCCPLPKTKSTTERRLRKSSEIVCERYNERVKGTSFGTLKPYTGKYCVASTPLIVGGVTANPEEYPQLAAIGWKVGNNKIKWACGGTLISERFVLTAGHCTMLDGQLPDIVRLGTINLSNITRETQDRNVSNVIYHPKYRPSRNYYDIALLELWTAVEFTKMVQPACLWQLSTLDIPKASTAGWGAIDILGPQSDELRKVDLDIINHATCKKAYSTSRRIPKGISDEQFCAGNPEGGKDTCQGDSGGGLYVELPEYNCVKFVIGITSFGRFCGDISAPGVYTKIFPYLDWLDRTVFNNIT